MKIFDVASQRIPQYQSLENQNTLSLGEIFTGRILSAKNGFLLMQLSDGSEIYAQVKADDTYNAGDILRLKVIEMQQNGSVITQVQEHIPNDRVAAQTPGNPESILRAMDLPVTEQALEVLKAIIEMGEKPSQELIENALNVMNNSNIEQPKHAVFLVLNGFEENEQYQSMLKNIDDGTFHLFDKLVDLIDILQQSDDANLSLAAEQFDSLTENAFIRSSQADLAMVEQWIHELQNEFGVEDGRVLLPADEFKSILESVFSRTSKADLTKLEQAIDELQSEFTTEDGKVSLLVDKFKSIMEEALIKRDGTGIPKVEQWINELQKQLESINEYISNPSGLAEQDTQNIQTTVKELQNAIQFFNDISNFEMFIQLPLTIKGQKTNGELYVMKRKDRASRVNPKDFSIFLSLSTENIGLLDIFVNVRSKNVTVKLTADNEEYKPLFMNEYKVLHEALNNKGFKLSELSVLPRGEKLNIFNAEQKANLLSVEEKMKIDIKV
ncbi:MAG TPA: flagellar hook-length control protein FliK [Thermoclostridium sp.]|nr:flagellar hook-length control protein FliK [Thermoclostridium sp.]